MARRIAIIVTALFILGAVGTPAALGDGDPASDTLLGQDVFYPYSPPVSQSAERALNALTAASAKQGFPVKVALIAQPLDLGVIPDLFNKPQPYADFLDQEISFTAKVPLLVVMPDGYGTQALPPAAAAEAKHLPPPSGRGPTALATAAIRVIPRMAAASGHTLHGVPGLANSGSGGGSSAPVIVVVVLVAVLLAGTAVLLRRRQGLRSRA
jgi:hypothetical protein